MALLLNASSAATMVAAHLPLINQYPYSSSWKSTYFPVSGSPRREIKRVGAFRAKACFNPIDDPIVKEALKEPVAFMSGMFAGFLRLDLNEDPLKEWVTRTVEASGVTEEEIGTQSSKEEEDAPQQIEIE